MSDEGKILGGTPFVSFDDAVEFLKRAPNPCPACGYEKWAVSTSVTGPNGSFAKAFAGANLESGKISPYAVPVVTATCKRCAFVRLHDYVKISQWIAQGKPEFKDDE